MASSSADKLDQELGRKNIEARRQDASLQQPLYHDPNLYNVDVYNMGVFHYEGLYIGMPPSTMPRGRFPIIRTPRAFTWCNWHAAAI